MTLTVEDGSGVSGADALISAADWKTYAEAHGYDWSDPPGRTNAFDVTTEIEPAIRRVSQYFAASIPWKGQKRNGRSQTMAWPRVDVCDEDGYAVDYQSVPEEVLAALCEGVWYELTTGPLSPATVLAERVKSEGVGDLSVTYAEAPLTASATQPTLPRLNDLIRGLVRNVGSVKILRA